MNKQSKSAGKSVSHTNKKQQSANSNEKRTTSTKSARLVALEVLVKVEEAEAFSNLQLNKTLQDAQLSRQDAALATEIVYGTISRKLTIDYILSKLVAKGLNKLQPWVLQLLRLSVYQIFWLDRIPSHAAVNEAVNIAKRKGHQGISGMVNGVLRNVLRNESTLAPDQLQLDNDVKGLSIRYSFPEWLVKRWIKQYGTEQAEQLLLASNMPPHSSIRVNQTKTTKLELQQKLLSQQVNTIDSQLAEDGLIVVEGGHLAKLDEFVQGLFSLQDESSMLVAEVLDPQPGMRVLDACAAPGGKSMHIAERMQGKGKLLSNDLHEHKAALIAQQAERLGLTNIEITSGDASLLANQLEAEAFDAILLDAPCSGFGVIKRKPEIKWTKQESDIKEIAFIQAKLLEAMSTLVKPGGVLVYSTCTIASEENEQQIDSFLAKHPQFRLDAHWPAATLARLKGIGLVDDSFNGQLQILPQHANSDGFFIARLVRAE